MTSFPDEPDGTKIYNNLTNRIVPRLVGIDSAPVESPDRVSFGVGVAYSGAETFSQTWRVNGRVGDSRVEDAGPVASILPVHTATDTTSELNIELIINPSGRTLTATLTLQGQINSTIIFQCMWFSRKLSLVNQDLQYCQHRATLYCLSLSLSLHRPSSHSGS